jgi:hypothetical protein
METFQEGLVKKEKAGNGGMKNNSTTTVLTKIGGDERGTWKSIRHQRKFRWDAKTKREKNKKSQTSTPLLPIHQGTVPLHALPRDS